MTGNSQEHVIGRVLDYLGIFGFGEFGSFFRRRGAGGASPPPCPPPPIARADGGRVSGRRFAPEGNVGEGMVGD